MKFKQSEQGLGLVAVIVIVAVLSFGGYATVSYMNANKVDIVTEEEMEEVMEEKSVLSASVMADLRSLKSSLTGSAEVNIDAALATIAEIKVTLAQAYASASATTKAEIDNLSAQLDEVETKLETGAADAEASLDALIDDIELTVENIDASSQTEARVDADADTTTDNNSASNEETMVETNASGGVQTDVSTDSDVLDVETETSLEADAGAVIN